MPSQPWTLMWACVQPPHCWTSSTRSGDSSLSRPRRLPITTTASRWPTCRWGRERIRQAVSPLLCVPSRFVALNGPETEASLREGERRASGSRENAEALNKWCWCFDRAVCGSGGFLRLSETIKSGLSLNARRFQETGKKLKDENRQSLQEHDFQSASKIVCFLELIVLTVRDCLFSYLENFLFMWKQVARANRIKSGYFCPPKLQARVGTLGVENVELFLRSSGLAAMLLTYDQLNSPPTFLYILRTSYCRIKGKRMNESVKNLSKSGK